MRTSPRCKDLGRREFWLLAVLAGAGAVHGHLAQALSST